MIMKLVISGTDQKTDFLILSIKKKNIEIYNFI